MQIYAGETVSLLGVNGCGKTTLIKILLGLERPSAGIAELNGYDPYDIRSRLNVGAVLQVSHMVPELTGYEILQFISQHFPQSRIVGDIVREFNLQEFIHKRTEILSFGQKKRLALSLAFVGNPKIIFLDEPTVGLDIKSRLDFWNLIKDYKRQGITFFLTTHYLEEAQQLSDRILILREGEIIFDGTNVEMNNKFLQTKINFKLDNSFGLSHRNPHCQKLDDCNYVIETKDADNEIRKMVLNDWPFYDIRINKNNLDELFLKLTRV